MTHDEKRALVRSEEHLRRLANHFCPPAEGAPSPFEEALARLAAGRAAR